jgi:hypothetical protein
MAHLQQMRTGLFEMQKNISRVLKMAYNIRLTRVGANA